MMKEAYIGPDDIVKVLSRGIGSRCLLVSSLGLLRSGVLDVDLGRGDLGKQLSHFVPEASLGQSVFISFFFIVILCEILES